MDTLRIPRSPGRAVSAHRTGPTRTAVPATGVETSAPDETALEGAVLSFLSEVLAGDNTWTMAEVQRLVVVRDLADLGPTARHRS